MSLGGVLVLADESAVVVDPSVCAFDDPAARLDPEPAGRGLRSADDLNSQAVPLGGLGDDRAGVSAVKSDMLNGRARTRGLADQCWKRGRS